MASYQWMEHYQPSSHLPRLSVSPSLQREDGAAVDGRRRLQDHLLRDERQPVSVLGVRLRPDPHRRGDPAPGAAVRPGHARQARLNGGVATGDVKKKKNTACVYISTGLLSQSFLVKSAWCSALKHRGNQSQ